MLRDKSSLVIGIIVYICLPLHALVFVDGVISLLFMLFLGVSFVINLVYRCLPFSQLVLNSSYKFLVMRKFKERPVKMLVLFYVIMYVLACVMFTGVVRTFFISILF